MDIATINHKTWFWLFFSVLVAYVYGLFVPLMDQDASHHAAIALHMYLHHDYVNLIDSRGLDYLDKPHLHFWLAALSYHLFGVNTLAYKLPSFLFTLLGVYSTFRLGRLLYNTTGGLLAALIFASAQAEFLANNDVRMDAILAASIVFAIWQLVEAAYFSRWYNYLLGALGLAMAFCTKGMIGFVMPCAALFFLLLYQRNWRGLFNWRWLVVLLLWTLFISPCVYCYYLQYDMHPEKVIRGMSHVSGVRFILWSQNFERLNGKHWGGGQKDYFFFFHTTLWAFLPWCLLTYIAFFRQIIFFIRTRFAYVKEAELLTAGTIIVIFSIISSSGFQLPHYLNVLFPVFALLTAGHLVQLQHQHNDKTLRIYLYIQYAVAAVVLLITALLNVWYFPVHNLIVLLLSLLFLAIAVYVIIKEQAVFIKIVVVSTLVIAATNVLLNGNAYPQLLSYEGGTGLARIVHRQHIPVQQVYTYNNFNSTTFDFYTASLVPAIQTDGIRQKQASGQPVWLLTDAQGRNSLLHEGFRLDTVYRKYNFSVTTVSPRFLNPATRHATLEENYLIKVGNRK